MRYDRTHFLAFGILPMLNALGLLLYGLGLATRSTDGSESMVPVLIVMAGIILLLAMVATVRRGWDLGWPAWLTVLAYWLTLGLGPILLILMGYFAFSRPRESVTKFGKPAVPATANTWVLAVFSLLFPWGLLAVLKRL